MVPQARYHFSPQDSFFFALVLFSPKNVIFSPSFFISPFSMMWPLLMAIFLARDPLITDAKFREPISERTLRGFKKSVAYFEPFESFGRNSNSKPLSLNYKKSFTRK